VAHRDAGQLHTRMRRQVGGVENSRRMTLQTACFK
jgi:hypothetical protein